jgi:hypothetical protein
MIYPLFLQKAFLSFRLAFTLALICYGILGIPNRATASERPLVAFLEMGIQGLSAWQHVTGEASLRLDVNPSWRNSCLKLSNEVIRGDLALPLDKGFTLIFKGSLSEGQRLLRVALMDEKGRLGYSVWYSTGAPLENEPERLSSSTIALCENESDHDPEWSDRHNAKKTLVNKKVDLDVSLPHTFILRYDAETGLMELSVNGEVVGTGGVEADKVKQLTKIYIWGNVWSYVGDMVVLCGPPVE